MIVFGTRPKYKTIDHGQFFCPRCQQPRTYAHKKASRYFTLYFIPIFPMGSMGEFVQCETCHTMFEMGVLQTKKPAAPRAALAQVLNTLGDRLSSGVPVEYLVRDLTAAGLDRDIALKMVHENLGAVTKTCHDCGLTYAPNVTTCVSCGKAI